MSGLCCGPMWLLWAWGKEKRGAEAGVGQDKGAAWVHLPCLGSGLREGTGPVGGSAGFGGFLLLHGVVSEHLGRIIRDF